jgi:dTMP kinase
MHGKLIVLEGPDGAGTTLHSKLLAERLEREGHRVLLTAEPTDGPVGAWIRSILKGQELMPASALQLLFTADRAWHIDRVIVPALLEGTIVITDRYAVSTYLYGKVQGLDVEWLKDLNKAFPQPDCQIFTLPPLEVCLERLARRTEHDIFEQREVLTQIHAAYTDEAAQDRSISVVDTSGEKQDVAALIFAAAKSVLS